MKKLFATLLIVAGLLTASLVGATVKLYTATAEDYASEVESQDIAKLRARDKAIKKATKEAGVYLKTYSRSVDNELTDDEVTAITSNSWQLVGEPKYTRKIINHSGDTQIIVWTATVEVNVDDAELQSWLKRDDKDKSTIITQTREAQKSSEENERTIEDLRERYNQAASQTERDKIRQQMNDADRNFLAKQKNYEGLKLHYAHDYNGAIKLYNEAMNINPKDISLSLLYRGEAYKMLGNEVNYKADVNDALSLLFGSYFKDLNTVLKTNPNDFEAYVIRGNIYSMFELYDLSISDYSRAIQRKSDDIELYISRGVDYRNLKLYKLAIQDFSTAIKINPDYCVAYYNRGLTYYMLKNYELAINDYTKAIEFAPEANHEWYSSQYHQLRGKCYQKLGDEAKAQADFNKAEQLGYDG